MLFNNLSLFKQIDAGNVMELNEYFRNVSVFDIGSDSYPLCGLTYLKGAYAYIDDYLFIIDNKKNLMCIPFNMDGIFIDVNHLYELMVKYKIDRISCIPDDCKYLSSGDIKKKFTSRHVGSYGFEYIYDNFALAGLEGKEWKNLRNKVHKFRNRYSDRIEIMPFDKTLMSSALACYDVWYETAGQKIVNSGEQIWDRKFFEICLHYYEELGIDMFLVKDNAEQKFIGCVAYTILADDFAYGIFRKLSSEYDYFSQYMQFYQADILSREYGIQYLNDAYDGGKEGLRVLKMGFKPVKTLKFVSLSVRKEKQK